MADGFTPRFVDLVRNTTTTVGTGNFSLGPAVAGFTGFAGAIQPGESFYYSCIGLDKPAEREVGRGTMQANGTISRQPIGGVLTNFTTGTKTVALIAAAEWFEKVQSGSGSGGSAAAGTAIAADKPALASLATTAPAILLEHGCEGLFAFDGSDLSAKVAADKAGAVYVAPASNPSGAGGAWVRKADVLTPRHFGATNAVLATEAEMTANTQALQAFFDFATDLSNARRYTFDWSGRWCINATIHAAYPGIDEVTRNFVAGSLVFPVRSAMPGGARVEHGMKVTGYRTSWTGVLEVLASWSTIDDMPFNYGVAFEDCNGSVFDKISVHGARRGGTIVLDTGNSISATIKNIETRYSGTHTITTAQQLAVGLTGPAVNGGYIAAWDPTPGSYNSSIYQRTRLPLDAAAHGDVRPYDIIASRFRFTAAQYGTVAASAANRTLSWSAGDPIALGLGIGSKLRPSSGVNADREFEILSFGGTSNRTITVWPAPQDEPATALTALCTAFDYHLVDSISGTDALVFPWLPEALLASPTRELFLISGASLETRGGDTANFKVSTVVGFACPIGVRSASLYGPVVSNLLAEYCDWGGVQGLSTTNASLGFEAGPYHAEAVRGDYLRITATPGVSTRLTKGSAGTDKIGQLTPRLLPTSPMFAARKLYNLSISNWTGSLMGGKVGGPNGDDQDFTGNFSNHPAESRRLALGPGSKTIVVGFDPTSVLLGHGTARLFWENEDGTAPTDTCTFQLNAELSAKGWTIDGDTVTTAPAGRTLFVLTFKEPSKRITVTRFVAAGSTTPSGDKGDVNIVNASTWNVDSAQAGFTIVHAQPYRMLESPAWGSPYYESVNRNLATDGAEDFAAYYVPAGKGFKWRVNFADIQTVDATGLNLAAGKALKVGGTQVVGQRKTGWTASTGAPSRGAFAAAAPGTASASYAQAELQGALDRIAAAEARLVALETDIRSHGLID